MEGQEGDQQRGEGYHGRHELLPSPVEILENVHGDNSGHKVHQEKLRAVMSENQQRQQGDYINRQHHFLLEKSQQVEGGQGEGHHVQQARIEVVHQEGDDSHQSHYEQNVGKAVEVAENQRVSGIYRKEEHQHQKQGQNGIAQPQENAGTAVAHAVLVFRLVRIQELLDFCGDNLALGHYLLPRTDIAKGRRNEIGRLGMHEVRRLLVVYKIWPEQLIHTVFRKYGIHLHAREFLLRVAQQLGTGGSHGIAVAGRLAGSPLVPLDENHIVPGHVGGIYDTL